MSPASSGLSRQRAQAPDGADAIATELAQVFDDRPSYLKKRASALADRNVNLKRPPADLPWLALVIALVRVKRVAPIDWKADLPDLLAALDRLVTRPKKASRWAWTKTADVADRSTRELLEQVGRHVMSEFELVLAGSTSPRTPKLFLSPAKDQKKLASLAKQAGGGLELFTGRNLVERELVRQRKAPLLAGWGVETRWDAPGNRKRISTTRTDVAR